MFLYENDKCPVCGECFKEGDDIIACPECGTPHHRACYNKANTCANARMHGTYFSFQQSDEKRRPEDDDSILYNDEKPKEKSDKLVISLVLLAVAVVAVLFIIGLRAV